MIKSRALLFDLDGTFVDTAPDLVGILNQLLREDGRPPLPYAAGRNVVSKGAIALLRRGYGEDMAAEKEAALRDRFLRNYQIHPHNNSRFFIELTSLYNVIHEFNAHWGIVTNKPTDLTNSLFERLAMSQPPGCIVCGDTLTTRKPDPATLLHAARLVDSAPDRSIYVGDSSIDIRAGRAAGMTTIAAAYGYIHPSDDIDAWGADAIIRHPSELVPLLKQLWK